MDPREPGTAVMAEAKVLLEYSEQPNLIGRIALKASVQVALASTKISQRLNSNNG